MKMEITCRKIQNQESSIARGYTKESLVEFKGRISDEEDTANATISFSIKGNPLIVADFMKAINIESLDEKTKLEVLKSTITGRMRQQTLDEKITEE